MPRPSLPQAVAVVLAVYVVSLQLAAEFIVTPPAAIHSLWYGSGVIVLGICLGVVAGAVARSLVILAVPLLAVAIQTSLDVLE